MLVIDSQMLIAKETRNRTANSRPPTSIRKTIHSKAGQTM